MENKKILDIGCGNNKLSHKELFPNYSFEGEIIGLDYQKFSEVDIVCDLEKGKLPFKDDSFDIIYTYSTLQYVSNVIGVIEEAYRILKKGGKFLIKVPYFSKSMSFTSLTWKSKFGAYTFDIFIKNQEKRTYYEPEIKKKNLFKLLKRKIYFNKSYKMLGIEFFANKFPNIYERFFCWIFPANGIKYELEKI